MKMILRSVTTSETEAPLATHLLCPCVSQSFVQGISNRWRNFAAVAVFSLLPSLVHAANSLGECNVTVTTAPSSPLPNGWSYQLQYLDTDGQWYNGAAGTESRSYYKQQGDWVNRSIQWRCQLLNNYSNYGSPQTATCYSGSDSVSFEVTAPQTQTLTITTQPVSQTVSLGTSVTFSVAASGTSPISYQWNKDGTPIPNATSLSYSIASVSSADAGNYTCTVSIQATTTTSNAAVLTVQGGGGSTTSSTFQVITGAFTWHQAKADAEARGGRLAVLNTQSIIDEANQILLDLNSSESLWIGLTDEVIEGKWTWVNGLPLTDNYWDNGQPDNYLGVEHYAHIWGYWQNLTKFYKWNDARLIQMSYLLEIPNIKLLLSECSHGTITGPGEYAPNSTATLTAVPSPGYVFASCVTDHFKMHHL